MTQPDPNSASAVQRWARNEADRTAVVYEDTAISYGELAAGVRETAALLKSGGLRTGDRVAWLGRNSASLLRTALAALHLGAIFVPLNWRLAGPELRELIEDSGVHTLLAEDEFRPTVDDIATGLPLRRHLLVDTDPHAPLAGEVPPRWTRLSTARATASAPEPAAVGFDDPALLVYTSGSTGRAKGVVITHGNLLWHDIATTAVIDSRLSDTALVVAPMFHIAGLNGFTLGTLAHGGTVVVRRAFDAERALADLVTHRVANLVAVPAVYSALAQVPGFGRADLSALRTALIGGAPVPPALVKEYTVRGIPLRQAWGLTETAPLAAILPLSLVGSHPAAAGHALPHTEVRLTDPATRARITEAGVDGEIEVRGPQVFREYWNDPEATRRAKDEAGWFRSGDIGRFDEQGLLYVVDRLKDVIISGGENIYPAEVERLLAEYPGVREAAVVGMPHARWGETPVAVVCREGEGDLTVADVRAFAGGRLARYKIPTAVVAHPLLPRTGSGKVDKPALRSWLEKKGWDAWKAGVRQGD
ncbi:class I adenylate-forming enzyme family protein [Streptomyces griseofuscus]|uniref:class I adenylate-forming enzyme family protein n=1 Tax=Streptomyces griseofuscus TaxID=146922 RepID=UPI0037FD2037